MALQLPSSILTNGDDEISGLRHLRTKPLTLKQERRLVNYLDDQFLQLTRGYKKRTSASTHVPTLHKYIGEARKLLSFILQIPPVDPSTELRTQFMLRLTGDVLNAIIGYKLTPPRRPLPGAADTGEAEGQNEQNGGGEEEPRDYTTALRELLDWLDDLDQAWVAVLESQVWDPDAGEGVDLVVDSAPTTRTPIPIKSTPISQTDVTRLRSLLVTSIASLEEWLSQARPVGVGAGKEDDVAGMLERLGLLDEFDDLFARTMDFLGGFSGGFVIEPGTIVDDEEDSMVEVSMSGCS